MEDEITKSTTISDCGTEILTLKVRDKDGIRAAFVRPVWIDEPREEDDPNIIKDLV